MRLTAAAARLASDHYDEAVRVARWMRWGSDPDETASDAGYALCQLAQAWVDTGGASSDFGRWWRAGLRWRLIDLWREQHGRDGLRAAAVPVAVVDHVVEPDAAGVVLLLMMLAGLPVRQRLVAAALAEGETLREVGVRLGVTESRVCQIRGEMWRSIA